MKKQKLGSTFHQRKAILRSLASALVLKEKIFTTEGKAKKMRPFLEKAITKAKSNTIASRRMLLQMLPVRVVDKLLKEIGPRYISQPGGYIRIIKSAHRKADAAKMVLMELVKK